MVNQEIAKIFYEMALLLEMDDVQFKPRAFERASLSIGALEEDVREIYKKGAVKALEEIPDVGKGIAERIEEYLKTNHIKDYEILKKKVPVDLEGLKQIEGLGPKKIKLLWQKLKVRTLADLEKAARTGKIRGIPTLGEKTEENILQGIEFVKKAGGRFLLGEIFGLVKEIEARLQKLSGAEKAIVAGSIRRMRETIGDADFLAVSEKPKSVMDYFVKMPEVVHVYARGETKSMVRLENGLDCDLRVVSKESFGAALNYFTGSKDHNIALRKIAIEKGRKLSEYGLFKVSGKRETHIAGRTEEDLYQALGLRYIEPELRENSGEIEASRSGTLPKELVGYGDLKGDLQVQTDWTDGANSIEEMAAAAKKAGLEYICITDHTRSLAMTGGADEKKLEKQMRAIDEINRTFRSSKFKVLRGAEVNILADGKLDIRDETLAKLDCVGAAVHSNFKMSKSEMTKRIIRACENPHVDVLFHPTGRIINRRPPYEVDIDEIIKAAKRTGTILEIDASPERLDLKDEYVRKCVRAGVKMVIDSDAHSIHGFGFLTFGIAQARRGWAEKGDIVNTRPLSGFLKALPKRYAG
ncbi:MAG: DNA polymerase III [Candidatus Sungbacteria bacterium RIFCSPLOWO2_01_FULL_59_16]|uniref:DNA polymerase beta n=1 Tax=Candidatus Sungbacteria bacterium RIFCSPLOWO2_01_FULL_59_16 TaxID=1802280 RepID=A0A1G2LBX4_9BACT|nr:MAG: DNA polymerase III [Candidatus Sungbacteria bacterium RIFCSPLOWO2_01_FULL_59_16]